MTTVTNKLFNLKFFLKDSPPLSEKDTTDIEAKGLQRGVLTMEQQENRQIVNDFINHVLSKPWHREIDFTDSDKQHLDVVNIIPEALGLQGDWRLVAWNYDKAGAVMLFDLEGDRDRVLDHLGYKPQ